jgi:hypothetical protein
VYSKLSIIQVFLPTLISEEKLAQHTKVDWIQNVEKLLLKWDNNKNNHLQSKNNCIVIGPFKISSLSSEILKNWSKYSKKILLINKNAI